MSDDGSTASANNILSDGIFVPPIARVLLMVVSMVTGTNCGYGIA